MSKRPNNDGTIYQSGSRWRVAVSVPQGPGQPPRRVWASAKTQREARQKLAELQRRLGQGEDISDRQTLGEFLEGWLPVYARSVAPATMLAARSLYRNHFDEALCGRRLVDLRVSDVDAWVGRVEARRGRRGVVMSPNTVRLCRSLLRRALRDAERQGILARNVAALSTPPRIPPPSPKYLEKEQLQRLLAASEDEDWGIGVWLLALLGLRRRSMLAACWSDYDAEGGTLAVRVGKTAATRRSYPVPPALRTALDRHRERCEALARLQGRVIGPGTPILATASGRPVDGANFYHWLRQLGEGVGIENCYPHRLRHSLATLMFNDGVELRTVSDVLGHSSVRITGDIYAAVLPATRSDALDRFAEQVVPVAPRLRQESSGDESRGRAAS